MASLRLKVEKIITSMLKVSLAHRYHRMVIQFNLNQSQATKALGELSLKSIQTPIPSIDLIIKYAV